MVLARKVLITCGDLWLSYRDLIRGCTCLIQTDWVSSIAKALDLKTPFTFQPLAWQALKNGSGLLGGKKGSFGQNLLETHLRTPQLVRATDPRDKVFGLLGFVAPPVNTDDPAAVLYADYSISAGQVYTRAAKATLLDSLTLEPLSYVQDRAEDKTIGLPSWVPDYNTSDKGSGLLILLEGSNFDASKSLPRHLKFLPNEQLIGISGFKVDEITMASVNVNKCCPSEDGLNEWLELVLSLPELYINGQESRTDVFWRTLIANIYEEKSPAHNQTRELCRYFLYGKVGGFFSKNYKDPSYQNKMASAHRRKLKKLGLWPDQDERHAFMIQGIEKPSEHMSKTFSKSFHDVFKGRTLFHTGMGYLGVGAKSLRAEDSVWILPGAIVPFILRKMESNENYQLIGEAYVHGIMHGELVNNDMWKPEDIVLE